MHWKQTLLRNLTLKGSTNSFRDVNLPLICVVSMQEYILVFELIRESLQVP
jgi:hypothetical protein